MRCSAPAALGWAVALALAWSPRAATAQPTVEQILSRHRQAIGGSAAWAEWRSLRLSGTISSEAGRDGTPFVMTFVNGIPGRLRMDFTVRGLPGAVAFDGQGGWSRSPFGEASTRPLSGPEIEAWRRRADFAGPLVRSADKGITVELLGRGPAGGLRLRASRAAGESEVLTLDPESYLVTRMETTIELQGEPIEVESLFTDYRRTGELLFARTIESRPRGAEAAQRLSIESAQLDVEVPPDLFAPPR